MHRRWCLGNRDPDRALRSLHSAGCLHIVCSALYKQTGKQRSNIINKNTQSVSVIKLSMSLAVVMDGFVPVLSTQARGKLASCYIGLLYHLGNVGHLVSSCDIDMLRDV